MVVLMETALIASNFLLWLLVIALLVIVFALARQIGVLHERVAPVGALMPMNGPKIGERVEPIKAQALDGTSITIGEGMDRTTLIYFLSPGCPVCKSLLPVVQEIEKQETGITVRYASDGETVSAHERYAAEHGIPVSNYLLSRELGMSLGVNKLPFAALINCDGVLRARGLVNNREHLESLLTADEMDVSSLQEYLGLSEESNHQ
jgi:methylamine dehydrogenase accessory protein MauD